jgi:hypothetical protein
MEAWRVWPRRQKIVSPKYIRGQFFLQAHADPSFLLTEGTRQVKDLPEGEKGHAKRIHARTDKKDTQVENPWIGRPVRTPSGCPLF